MRASTILSAALLLLTFACKQSESVNTTSSSETTSTVAEGTTTGAAAPVTDTLATAGTTGSAMTETVSTAAPAQASTPTTASATRSAEKAKKVAGSTVTEPASSSAAAGLPKNPALPPASAPAAPEAKKVPAESEPAAAPAPSSNASLVSTGQGIFKTKCVACHGSDASGNTAIGKKNNIPDFRSATVQGQTDAALAAVIANGKGPISASAHKSKRLSTDEINATVAYIRSLR